MMDYELATIVFALGCWTGFVVNTYRNRKPRDKRGRFTKR
jgi:hypothetical protein